MDWSPDQKFGVAAREDIAALTGRQFLQAMIDGRVPAPPIARTLSFRLVEVGEGFAVRMSGPVVRIAEGRVFPESLSAP